MKVYNTIGSLQGVTRHSIFLAGPTPRSPDVLSWRPEALSILTKLNFAGDVLVPEPVDGKWPEVYSEQAKWEWAALEKAGCILFWVPRDMDTMPGMTTNIEWGMWARGNSSVLGSPPGAPHMQYMQWMAQNLNIPHRDSLWYTVVEALTIVDRLNKEPTQ